MKKYFSILLLSASIFSFSQVIDTAQVVIPKRSNSIEAQAKPYVIMISADGFRYDYAEKYHAKNLLNLAKSGVKASYMLPSFPSITFPNHWSLITGLYPSHHGLVDNFFYDYKRKDFYSMSDKQRAEDGSWYGGKPLWSLAEQQGMLSASLMWVGSASDAGGARPTYYYHYQQEFSPIQKVDKVVNWLRLPMDKRPHFITLYFPEVDASGHRFGPDSKETENAVLTIDEAVGNLVKKVNKLGLKNVNYIFVSDHGMIRVDDQHPIEIPKILLDKSKFDIFNSQTLLRVVVKNPDEVADAFKELKKNETADYTVFLDNRFPRKLNFKAKDDRYNRIGQILLVPHAPKIFLEEGKKTSFGKHGYNPWKTPEMRATFIGFGPTFRSNLEIGAFRNVNIFPIVTTILGLKNPDLIDGNNNTAKKVLVKD